MLLAATAKNTMKTNEVNKMKLRITLLLALVATVSGCTTSKVYLSTTTMPPPLESSVLILPPDVVVSEQTAGGDIKPRADWTESVQTNLNLALEDFFLEKGIRPIKYDGATIADEDIDIIHQANINLDAIELTLKKAGGVAGTREYAIPEGLLKNLSKYDADYAVLIVLNISRPTAGRFAMAVLIGGAAMFERDTYRVALLDLRDGQVAWANYDPQALSSLGWSPAEADSKKWQKTFTKLFAEFPL